ncbi:tetratricopeptide repeat-containing response regulator [Gynuella sunshinyii]|nr:tetratricopeptide repeat-containing response regulator [Gynuella sunshinyii]
MNHRVLVIDDFENARKSARAMLLKMGVNQVFEAANAKEAMLLIQKNFFHVVLCDFNLGTGMDGQQLLEELRYSKTLSYQTTYVMVTAETSREMVMGAVEIHPDDYLAKPYAFDSLAARWKRWIQRNNDLKVVLTALDDGEVGLIIDECNRIIQQNPRYRAWAQKLLSETLIKTEQLAQAEILLSEWQSRREQPWIWLELARISFASGDLTQAESYVGKVIELHPNYAQAYDLLADIYRRKNGLQRQYETLQTAVKISPRNHKRQDKLARVSYRLDDLQAASKALKDSISLKNHTSLHNIEDYQRLLAIQVESCSLDDQRHRRHYVAEITNALKRIQEAFPDQAESGLTEKFYKMQLKAISTPDFKPGEEEMNSLFEQISGELENSSGELGLSVASFFYEHGRMDQADQLVNRLRAKDPDKEDFVHRLNELQSEPITKDSRKEAARLNAIAKRHYEQKNVDRAMQFFERALEISPRNPALILNYVQCVLKAKRNSAFVDNADQLNSYLNRLSYLHEDSPQYARYEKLKKLMESS